MVPPKARKWYNIHEEPQSRIFNPNKRVAQSCRHAFSSVAKPIPVGRSRSLPNGTGWFKTSLIWLMTIVFTAFQTWCCTFALSTVLFRFGCTPEGVTTACIPLEILPGFGPFFRLQHRLVQMSGKIDDMEWKLSQLEDQLPLEFHNRDFALWGLGAQIIPELTSKGEEGENVILPSAVLEDPPLLGECWEFAGRRGHLGIRLSETANITAMSVSYVRPSRLTKRFRSKIPTHLVLWGLIPAHATSTSLQPVRQPHEFMTVPQVGQHFEDSAFVPLVHAHYDGASPQSRQIFPVTSSVTKTFRFNVVIVEVLDNWGGETTCLYHIGVHGLEE